MPDAEPEHVEALIIPPEALAEETLSRVIESFILREGTDYGFHEMPLASKVQQVRQQLLRGEARIVFDPGSDSIDIVLNNDPRSTRA